MEDTNASKAPLPTSPSLVDRFKSCDGLDDGVVDAAAALLSFKKPKTALPTSPRPTRASSPPPSTSETNLTPRDPNQVNASPLSPYSSIQPVPIPAPVFYLNHTPENNILPLPPHPFPGYFERSGIDDYNGSGAKHDNWSKVSIKTAKCDHCSGRNRSVLQRCDDCSRQVCKECMRTFPSEDIHFADPDQLDWKPDPIYFYRRHSKHKGGGKGQAEEAEEAVDNVDMGARSKG